MNFDAKIRRQSIDPDDILYAHVASMDACARGLLNAAKLIEDGKLDAEVNKRYAKWSEPTNKAMLEKGASLESIAARVHKDKIEPQPKSGRQEYIEALLNNV
jgi:xylose isomerase